ncbi:MAG: type I DNA topoisomerase [Alphaproteobacteria bacterium]|nr:type I DNA topoisomerase [Alphaproteobacteria bacterium]
MKLVIVESPAKAKTINKYLGKDYQVIASFGHIRDLPAKDGSVLPDDDFKMTWALEAKGEKHVKDIIAALSKADEVYLASDPDREGEAIAWHIVQELTKRKKLNVPYHRVVFNEITKSAVTEAMKNPREIDMDLVNAYLARRALDYLVGFTLSPVLWRKLPGSKSAGRVQSVALRLVCERESEIEAFKPQEYWTLSAQMETASKEEFKASLTHLDGKKLDKFALGTGQTADAVKARVLSSSFHVGEIEKKQVKRNPAPAFTTSTLQQEASRKLGFSAKKTMKTAQELYEGVEINGDRVGLITYMRTDGVALAQEAIEAMRAFIEKEYGKDYLPEKPRVYKNKVINAQEAHEAIRPTNINRTPDSVAAFLDKDHLRLYELVWKRALACQMESALLDKVAVDIPSADNSLMLHATGQTIAFAGFIKVYKEDIDDKEDEEEGGLLPLMNKGDALNLLQATTEQHFTEPPPRYSEASLVKKMEELGIGRPSTYASILSVLQDRQYVVLNKKRFVPEERGRIVTAFLENYFNQYVQYDFTAKLENLLDDITSGQADWKKVLSDFWRDFYANVQQVSPSKMADVLQKVDETLEKHLFPTPESRVCPECKKGTLSLKVGRFGAFIGCSNYPECKYTRQFSNSIIDEEGQVSDAQPNTEDNTSRLLGQNEKKENIYIKKGPYGWYVQQGEGKESKRSPLPKNWNAEEVTLERAVGLLSLPRVLGKKPETNETVEASIGRFGPYIKCGNTFQSLSHSDDVLTVDLKRALEILENAKSKTKDEGVPLGDYQGTPILWIVGRYGPYLKWGKQNIPLPKELKGLDTKPTLAQAIEQIEQKNKK